MEVSRSGGRGCAMMPLTFWPWRSQQRVDEAPRLSRRGRGEPCHIHRSATDSNFLIAMAYVHLPPSNIVGPGQASSSLPWKIVSAFHFPLFFISSLNSPFILEIVPTPPNTSAVYTIATLAPASNTSSACRPFVMPPEAKITVLGFAPAEAVIAVGLKVVSAGVGGDGDEGVCSGEDEGGEDGNWLRCEEDERAGGRSGGVAG